MKASDWIKVEDRLPEEGQLCLVKDNRGNYWCGKYEEMFEHSEQWGFLCGPFFILDTESNWMPIVPPKED
jgi:hypothetical protein